MKYFFLSFFAFFILAASAFSQGSAPNFILNGNELVLPFPIRFEAGTDIFTKESESTLEFIKAYLMNKPHISLIRIEGHVSETRSPEEDEKLSEKRAMAVAKWLIEHEIECARLLATGFGNTKPIIGDKTPEAKIKNTRISIVNAMIKGQAIGGMPVDGGGWVSGDPCN